MKIYKWNQDPLLWPPNMNSTGFTLQPTDIALVMLDRCWCAHFTGSSARYIVFSKSQFEVIMKVTIDYSDITPIVLWSCVE